MVCRYPKQRYHMSLGVVTVLLLSCPWSSRGEPRRHGSRRSTCTFVSPALGQSRANHRETCDEVLHPKSSIFQTFELHQRRRSKLFADKKKEHKEAEDDDFPTWVKGLNRWPLYPPSAKELEAEKKFLSSNSTVGLVASSIRPIPLANLINVEALLTMNEKDTLENNKDLDLYAASGGKSTEALENNTQTPLSILARLEDLGNFEKLASSLRQSVAGAGSGTSAAIGGTTDAILKEATSRIDKLITEASTVISPSSVQELVQRAGRALSSTDRGDPEKLVEQFAEEQGLDVREAAEQAKKATEATTSIVKLANRILQNGYAHNDDKIVQEVDRKAEESKPLFAEFKTAKIVQESEYKQTLQKTAELASLSGAIYEETIPRTLELGHAIVANGTTSDVNWMVTDCVASESEYRMTSEEHKPTLVRTITIRGFDASDENIDREGLLNTICTATPEPLKNGVMVHCGLMSLARAIYKEIMPYVDLTGPQHRIVINGHSVGGSISIMLLLLMVEDRGVEFVRDKVLRVFTFGSPPVISVSHDFYDGEVEEYLRSISGARETDPEMEPYKCDILRAFGLPSTMVFGFVQPWDPIIRLFSDIDPLYPLVNDIGEDGFTPYASGPPRTLRVITRAIFESWEGWPLFRDTFRSTVNQNYTSVGVQHILLPEPIRYLSDRLVAANVNVPPVETMLRISSKELLPGLDKHFPLDPFRISYVPAAIRGFVHHFYPAYGFPVVDFASKKLKRRAVSKKVNDGEKEDYRIALNKVEEGITNAASANSESKNNEKVGSGWTAPGWLQVRKEL